MSDSGGQMSCCQHERDAEALRARLAEATTALRLAHDGLVSAEAVMDGEMGDWADHFNADWDCVQAGKRAIADVMVKLARESV